MGASRIAADRGACGRATAAISVRGTVLPGQHETSEEALRRAFARLSLSASSHSRQSPIVGPDGDPRPPECAEIRPPRARRRRIPLHSKTPLEAPPVTRTGMDYILIGMLSTSF